MSDKETTPNSTTTAAANTKPNFSERELELLAFAIQSLKSGPPEVDYDKLAAFAGMSNPRSASNAWAKIRSKLMTPADGSAPAAATPKKGGAKKKTHADGEEAPRKTATPRKRAAKKQDVDGEESPKKKTPRAQGKKAEDKVKAEAEDNDELKLEIKDEENVEGEI